MDVTRIKTRFAPSPTGLLHLGNVRTALFNALYARNQCGIFLLRIEDTDAERSREEYSQQLMTDLRWLGLDWQEGPQVGGAAAPYQQSQRQAVYDQYYAALEAQAAVYPCFCSAQELNFSRKRQRAAGQAPRYAGTCAHLSAEQVARKRAQGLQPTLRFRVPQATQIQFTDLVRGPQQFAAQDIGDFIIRRADGSPAFFFCNAIDDALMGITHVFRGEDHLTNTPRQLLMLQALGLPIPQYGHISLIVGPDGTPLSKRHGSHSLKELRETGWLNTGLCNYLARLGHTYSQEAFMELDALAGHFDIARLGRAPAHYDAAQMRHWQQLAIHRSDDQTLRTWLGDAVQTVPTDLLTEFMAAVRPNISFPDEARDWATILFTDPLLHTDSARAEIAQAGPAFFALALTALAAAQTDWAALIAALKTSSDKKGKALFMPLRAALTGQTHGPEMGRLLPLMGLARAQQRLQACLSDSMDTSQAG